MSRVLCATVVENKEECSIPIAADAEERAEFLLVPAAVAVEDWVVHSIAYAAAVAELAHAN
jgi:hypothetical protein